MAGYVYLGHRFIGYHYGDLNNTTFGGLTLAPADCYLDSAGAFQIDTLVTTLGVDYYKNSHDSFGSSYDATNSTYFSSSCVAGYFGTTTVTMSDTREVRTINNSSKVTGWDGLEYRVATTDELDLIFFGSCQNGSITRLPAVVDGEYNVYSALVAITSGTGITTKNAFGGLLVYPDSKELSGVPNSFISSSGIANTISLDTLKSAIDQGAVFIRHNGDYYYSYGQSTTYGSWTRCGDGTTKYYSFGDQTDNFTWPAEIDYYDATNHAVYPAWYVAFSPKYQFGGYNYATGTAGASVPYALPLRLVTGTMSGS